MSQRDPPDYWLWFAIVSAAAAMLTLALMRSAPTEHFVQHMSAAVTTTLPD
jgi:hypothetical protein